MSCPKEFYNKKVSIDPVVFGSEFFNIKPVNEWTFQDYIMDSNVENLKELRFLLRDYKNSLFSLGKLKSLDRDLKAYIGTMKQKDV